MSLLEKCKEISHTPTPKVCFLTKTVPLQTLSMGVMNNFKLRRKTKFKFIPVYFWEIKKHGLSFLCTFNMERLAEFKA